jgi:hypothetical protein
MHRYGLGSYDVVLQRGMVSDWFSLGLLFYSVFRARERLRSAAIPSYPSCWPLADIRHMSYSLHDTINSLLHGYVTFQAAMALLGLHCSECRLGLQSAGRL